jgi:diadenylate cyclase
MDQFTDEVRDILDQFTPTDVLDILLIAFAIYWVLLLFRGTAAVAVLRGAAITLVGAVILAQALNLETLDWLIRNSLTGLIIAVPIIFQPEIRRALERVGRTGLRVWARPGYDGLIDKVSAAAGDLARQRHGALIVIERDTGLQSYIDSGVPVDAEPSIELIEGLFYPNSPLHDGAVVLRENRVAAAAVTLPVSDSRLPGDVGLRHRAALGVTEQTDAVAVVVSDETGTISVAADGRLYPQLDEGRLRGLLGTLLGPRAGALSDNGRRSGAL